MPFNSLNIFRKSQESAVTQRVREALKNDRIPDIEGLEAYEGNVVIQDMQKGEIRHRRIRARVLLGTKLDAHREAERTFETGQHQAVSPENDSVFAALFFESIRYLLGNRIAADDQSKLGRAFGAILDQYEHLNENRSTPYPLVVVHAHGFASLIKGKPSVVTGKGGRPLRDVFDAICKDDIYAAAKGKIPAILVVCNEAQLSIQHPKFNILYNKGLVGFMERPNLHLSSGEEKS